MATEQERERVKAYWAVREAWQASADALSTATADEAKARKALLNAQKELPGVGPNTPQRFFAVPREPNQRPRILVIEHRRDGSGVTLEPGIRVVDVE